ncbi:hypothetical protein BKA82DRAFT_4011113 [Pisolithus tinctorius]|nr:hypothetical protein BKA82DRAFT_4011113 [Pisolithus tinctorius]
MPSAVPWKSRCNAFRKDAVNKEPLVTLDGMHDSVAAGMTPFNSEELITKTQQGEKPSCNLVHVPTRVIVEKGNRMLIHGVPATSREVKLLVSGVQEHSTEGNEPTIKRMFNSGVLGFGQDTAHTCCSVSASFPTRQPYIRRGASAATQSGASLAPRFSEWRNEHWSHSRTQFACISYIRHIERYAPFESADLEEKLSTVPPISESHARDTPRPVPRKNMG